VFSKLDIDHFESMNELDIEYKLHSTAWEAVLEVKTIQGKLISAELKNCDCLNYYRRVRKLWQIFSHVNAKYNHASLPTSRPGSSQNAKKSDNEVELMCFHVFIFMKI